MRSWLPPSKSDGRPLIILNAVEGDAEDTDDDAATRDARAVRSIIARSCAGPKPQMSRPHPRTSQLRRLFAPPFAPAATPHPRHCMVAALPAHPLALVNRSLFVSVRRARRRPTSCVQGRLSLRVVVMVGGAEGRKVRPELVRELGKRLLDESLPFAKRYRCLFSIANVVPSDHTRAPLMDVLGDKRHGALLRWV